MTALIKFFKKIEDVYNEDAMHCVKNLIQHGKHINSSHKEIDLVIRIILKLRSNLNQNMNISKVLEETLKGGHLKFDDDGALYKELIVKFNTHLQKRSSSHKSSAQQYSFTGPVVKEVLIGVSRDKHGNKKTWIQFERHHMKTIVEFILHLFDYLRHKWTGKNIGPYGSSQYTEKNPLTLVYN